MKGGSNRSCDPGKNRLFLISLSIKDLRSLWGPMRQMSELPGSFLKPGSWHHYFNAGSKVVGRVISFRMDTQGDNSNEYLYE
jgi:hypothetical protein